MPKASTTPLPAINFAARSRSETEKSIFQHLEDPKATASLPSLKSVLAELEALTRNNNIRLDEVTQLVQVDQGMSLRVLRMANSVYYAPAEPIMDVRDAILYIGLSTLRGAVVSTRCIEKTCHIKQSVIDWKDFWMHAAGVGHITLELAAHLKTPDIPAESCHLMGLLHDIGKVVLAHLVPNEFNKIYRQAAKQKKSPCELEIEYLGIDHGQLGAWYLEKQGIPFALCQPVRFHHCEVLEDKPHAKLALIIRLADLLAMHAKLGQSGNFAEFGDPYLSPEWGHYLTLCGHSEADGEPLKETIVARVEGICDLVRKIII